MDSYEWIAPLAGFLLVITAPAPAQQPDTIRVGSPSLRGAALAPGSYTIVSVRRAEGKDTPNSTTRITIMRAGTGADEVYLIQSIHASAAGDTTIGAITARASDFALVHHRVKGVHDSTAVAAADGFVTGWVVLPNQPVSLIDQPLPEPVFPMDGQVPWLFPLLPLDDGYVAAIPHFSQWAGGTKWTSVRVLGSEKIDVNGKLLDCWKVDGGELFRGYRVTYWVDKDARRIVRGVARGAEGAPEYWSWLAAP